jgi:hypothetical protein
VCMLSYARVASARLTTHASTGGLAACRTKTYPHFLVQMRHTATMMVETRLLAVFRTINPTYIQKLLWKPALQGLCADLARSGSSGRSASAHNPQHPPSQCKPPQRQAAITQPSASSDTSSAANSGPSTCASGGFCSMDSHAKHTQHTAFSPKCHSSARHVSYVVCQSAHPLLLQCSHTARSMSPWISQHGDAWQRGCSY